MVTLKECMIKDYTSSNKGVIGRREGRRRRRRGGGPLEQWMKEIRSRPEEGYIWKRDGEGK